MSYIYGKAGTVFTGRLIKDPETRQGNRGDYMQLSISVQTGIKKDGEQYAPSIIISTTVADTARSACSRLQKGDIVTVSTMGISSREGQDGKKWYNAYAESVSFDAAVIARLCLKAAEAAVDAMNPDKEPELLPDDEDDGQLPF